MSTKTIRVIIYNYPLKGRWIVVDIILYQDAKRRGIYLALWTDPEGDSCFSIYRISWIKIKKELFVHKRHHLVRVCLRFNWHCFGDHFLWFCCNFSKKKFFYRPVNTDKPNFVCFLVFVNASVSLTTKISSFETVAKREDILNPVPKQWISKAIPSCGSQSEYAKITIHWFGEY